MGYKKIASKKAVLTRIFLFLALAIIWPLMSRCTVVSKRSLQYLVPFGTATWLWGTVFIDRGAQTARDALNKQVDAIKNQKVKLSKNVVLTFDSTFSSD